jgi:carbonic anhydrase
MEKSTASTRDSSNVSFVNKVCALNVQVQINEIIHSSDIIQDMLAAKQIGMVGGVYNLATGEVSFLPDTLML